jgi:hypothetical protein
MTATLNLCMLSGRTLSDWLVVDVIGTTSTDWILQDLRASLVRITANLSMYLFPNGSSKARTLHRISEATACPSLNDVLSLSNLERNL